MLVLLLFRLPDANPVTYQRLRCCAAASGEVLTDMPRFVLEIGTEELPPRYFPPALSQLHDGAVALLAKARLTHGEVKVYGTPRRLVLVVEEMAAVQAPAVRDERGPSAKVAFDAEGKPTKAATGFARRHGIAPEDLERRQTDLGEYVFAVIHEPEAPAKDALAALLPDLITGLSFPKSMRWGAGTIRFGRPMRWILALVDDEVVEFSVGEVRSGRLARGHPVLADGMFDVKHADQYESALEEQFVIVEPEKRKGWIERLVYEKAGAQVEDAHETLLDETTFLVEWATAARGGFDPTFLRLPEEVLVEEMRHVQSYFPLKDQQGKLAPFFVGVRDGGLEHLETVVAGWENVLRAKLIDANYFYEQDLKRPLADRVEDLKGVVFQEKLGSMYDKMERVRAIAAGIAVQVEMKAHRSVRYLDRAAYLCKADLTTEMVSDLPSLQGIMGGEYARWIDGEPVQVWEAIAQHYQPRSVEDDVPLAGLGRLLAIADKVDTITACFAAGIVPSGSADPLGLRREAIGIIRILADENSPRLVSVSDLVGRCLSLLSTQASLACPVSAITADVVAFLGERLGVYLRETVGVRYDLVQAAMSVGNDDVPRTILRARALQRLATTDAEFLPVLIASTRASNIVKGFAGGDVTPTLFEHESERALWSAYQKALPEAEASERSGDYVGLFRVLGGLREAIDRFFNDVLVMAEDPEVRNNRLALCWQVNQLFRRLADFTVIVQA